MTEKFLDGIVVAELGERTSAGACGSLLAMLGAEVVFVEPFALATEHKWSNRAVASARKHSIDNSGPDGEVALATLLARADIVLTSSDISDRDKAIMATARSEDQIVCDFTAFGGSGPLAHKPLSDALVQGWCGVADTTGKRDGAPAVLGAPFVSMEAGAYGAAAVLSALRVRSAIGNGQVLDIALYDVGVNALLTFVPLCLIGKPATRNGNRHPTLSPWNSYPAADGRYVLICAPKDDQWQRLCDLMGRPELASDLRFATTTARMENVEAIDLEIEAWTSKAPSNDLVDQINAVGIPASLIVGMDDLPREKNVMHRSMSVAISDPMSGQPVFVPGNVFKVAGATKERSPHIPAVAKSWSGSSASKRPAPEAHDRRELFSGGPLSGLRIVEIGMNTVAPLAGRQLGALGADVIKVEPPTGDTNRYNAPLREDGASYVFMLSNTDKRGIVLNLKDAVDREKLFDLLSTADAVIENLKPGALTRLGLGAEDVLARFPKLVYCTVNGFGFDTVYPGRPALDTVIQAMSGAMDATRVDGMPTKAGISISDQLGGQFGLVALIAGIRKSRLTGKGMHIDLAMQDATAWATSMLWNGATAEATKVSTLQVSDGYVLAACEGVPHFPPTLSRTEAVSWLEQAGIAASPVLGVDEVLAHPQTKERELFIDVSTADGSKFPVLGCPMKLSSTPAINKKTMPDLSFVDVALEAELAALSGRPDGERAYE